MTKNAFAVFLVCVAVVALAWTVYAGNSGVSNPVSQTTPEYQTFKEKQIDFNNDVVTALDTAFTGLTKTNTFVYLDGNTNKITNVVTITKGRTTAWTTNGVSI